MKQFHLVPSIATDFGGLGFAALRHAEAQAKAGADVTLYIIDRTKNELDIDKSSDLLTIAGGYGRCFMTRLSYLIGHLKNHRFDIVHIHGTWVPLQALACYISFWLDVPVVISPHGCLEPQALKHHSLKKKLALALYQKRIYSKASMMMATANQELDGIRRLGISTPTAVIPLGVDIPQPIHYHKSEKRTFLFLSRIHPIKGLPDLVKAWAAVRRPRWRIIIAGPDEGGHIDEIRQLVSTLGLERDFEFQGLVSGNNKEALFAQCDFFVLPTYSENFGIVVAEALARGIPVITTTGAPWEDINKWRCGWWVNPGVDGIASALASAMDTSQQEILEMGERGARLISQKYSWNHIAQSTLSAYKWILQKNLHKPDYIDLYHQSNQRPSSK